MSMQIAPYKDPGLWSVLENGVAVLKGEEMEDGHRALVLECLVSIFSEADRGASVVAGQNLLVMSGDTAAIEQFSLFFDYLAGPLGDDLPARLNEGHALLKGMAAGQVAAPELRVRTREMLEALLGQLQKAAQLEPLVPMREFSY